MSHDVITVTPDMSFKAAVQRLLERDISGLPVVDSTGRLVGVVTEADVMTKWAGGGRRHRALTLVAAHLTGHDPAWVRRASGLTAAEIMTSAVATARPDDDVRTAARVMLERNVKRLPVVDEDRRLAGIVSRQDLLHAFVRSDSTIEEEISRVLTDPTRSPETAHVWAVVRDGIVHLTGYADFPADVDAIIGATSKVDGVVAVHNQIVVRRPITVGAS